MKATQVSHATSLQRAIRAGLIRGENMSVRRLFSTQWFESKKKNGFFSLRISASSHTRSSSLDIYAQKNVDNFGPWNTENQRTLRSPISLSGVGLHGGVESEVNILPAKAGEGRYFVMVRKDGREEKVAATLSNVCDTRLSTTLGKPGEAVVQTVEHLLSSLEGLGVDNARIEVRGGSELPILDGSAREWVEAIQAVGISEAVDDNNTPVRRSVLSLQRPIMVEEGDSYVKAFPSSVLKFTYQINFPQLPVVGNQVFEWTPGEDSLPYSECVASARTFGILEQFEQLRSAGLIKGGSLNNALVCSMETGWVNPPLRFPDEPCRHKLLDLIGDLALCAQNGNPGIAVAHIVAHKASHGLHVKFGKAFLEACK